MKRTALAFCVAIACMASASHSFATTLSLSFSGTVDFVNNAGLDSGIAIGQPINGSMMLSVTNPSTSTPEEIRYSGLADYELTGFPSGFRVGGTIDNRVELNHSSLEFAAPGFTSLELEFSSNSNTAPLFNSLSDIPDVATLIALYGNASGLYTVAPSGLHFPHFIIGFSIDGGHLTVNDTPIPPALPLFASALGGLAFMGWRRKNSATTA
jgi:hypothetical protein